VIVVTIEIAIDVYGVETECANIYKVRWLEQGQELSLPGSQVAQHSQQEKLSEQSTASGANPTLITLS
jgi:hypothetical protein